MLLQSSIREGIYNRFFRFIGIAMDTKDNKNTQQISDEEQDKNSGRKLDDEDMNKVAGGIYQDDDGTCYWAQEYGY